jgi:hypothetical protein
MRAARRPEPSYGVDADGDSYPATDGKYGLGIRVERLRNGTRRLWHDGSDRG